MLSGGWRWRTERPRATVRVDVLGPLRLVVDGAPVEVRGPKRRAVLALLALAEGRAVTADHLVDALWPSAPPESGRAALHSHVSRLRGQLGPGPARLVTLDGGYRLVLGADGSTWRGPARCWRRPARPRDATRRRRARCCARRWRSGAARRSPTWPRSCRWRPAVAGFEQLRREVTDLLIRMRHRRRAGRRRRRARRRRAGRRPAARAGGPAADARAGGDRAGPQALRTGRAYRRRLAAEAGLDPSAELGELEQGIAGGAIGPVHAAGSPDGPAAGPRPRGARPGEPADRPGGPGGRGAAAARHRAAGHASSVRAGSARPGSRSRSPGGPKPRRCCCWRRSPIRRPSRTRWPQRSACRRYGATCWRPASRSSAAGPHLLVDRQLRARARRGG